MSSIYNKLDFLWFILWKTNKNYNKLGSCDRVLGKLGKNTKLQKYTNFKTCPGHQKVFCPDQLQPSDPPPARNLHSNPPFLPPGWWHQQTEATKLEPQKTTKNMTIAHMHLHKNRNRNTKSCHLHKIQLQQVVKSMTFTGRHWHSIFPEKHSFIETRSIDVGL